MSLENGSGENMVGHRCVNWLAAVKYIYVLIYNFVNHYSDDIMGAMAYQITSPRLFTQPFIREHIKGNIKAHHDIK